MSGVTAILQAIGQGDEKAPEELMAIVYDELHRLATNKLARESPGHTLQPTALVHEAYLRLLPPIAIDNTLQEKEETHSADGSETPRQATWESRAHFFGAAAEAMRRILIDVARKKNRLKRGGDRARVELDGVQVASPEDSIDLLALDDALTRLEQKDPMKAEIVKLRYFAGLTLEDTASALNISVPTVHRQWRYARAWLRREMEE